MTTTATHASTGPVAANGTAPIAFTFQSLSASEIEVWKDGSLVSSDQYIVSRSPDGTGSVTPLTSWGTSEVYIYSAPSYQQPTAYARHGAFYPDLINTPLDRLARSIIALRRLVTSNVAKTGDTMTGALSVPFDTYDEETWNGSAEVPTKNNLRDKFVAMDTQFEGKFIDDDTTLAMNTFADLPALLAYLKPRKISSVLTIELGDETITNSGLAVLDHPDAHNLRFTGVTAGVTINSVGAITSNAAYSHDVVLNLADASSVSVGNFIYIAAGYIGDVSSSWLEGSWRVLSKASNAVTVRVTDRRTSLPAPTVASVPAVVQKSIFKWDSTLSGGLVISGSSGVLFEDIVFDGGFDVVNSAPDDSTDGITIATSVHATTGLPTDQVAGVASATFRRCSIVRWRSNGCYGSGAGTLDITTSHSCSNGWRPAQAANGASLFAKSCVFNGNRKAGPTFETGGSITINNSTIFGNGEQGLYGIGGGSGTATVVKIGYNGSANVEVKDAGIWNIDSSYLITTGSFQVIANGPGAMVAVDGVTTSGATSAAFTELNDGRVYYRGTPPTVAEATRLSSDMYGVYTPTLTNVTNIAASTPETFQYQRVGNVVTVSGRLKIDPTASAGTNSHLGISLPIASDLDGTSTMLAGVGSGDAGQHGNIYGDTFNNRANLRFLAQSINNEDWSVIFTYRIN